jgi:hypothetical protein
MEPDVILRRFEQPDEVREMTLGRFEIIRLAGQTIRADRVPRHAALLDHAGFPERPGALLQAPPRGAAGGARRRGVSGAPQQRFMQNRDAPDHVFVKQAHLNCKVLDFGLETRSA